MSRVVVWSLRAQSQTPSTLSQARGSRTAHSAGCPAVAEDARNCAGAGGMGRGCMQAACSSLQVRPRLVTNPRIVHLNCARAHTHTHAYTSTNTHTLTHTLKIKIKLVRAFVRMRCRYGAFVRRWGPLAPARLLAAGWPARSKAACNEGGKFGLATEHHRWVYGFRGQGSGAEELQCRLWLRLKSQLGLDCAIQAVDQHVLLIVRRHHQPAL